MVINGCASGSPFELKNVSAQEIERGMRRWFTDLAGAVAGGCKAALVGCRRSAELRAPLTPRATPAA